MSPVKRAVRNVQSVEAKQTSVDNQVKVAQPQVAQPVKKDMKATSDIDKKLNDMEKKQTDMRKRIEVLKSSKEIEDREAEIRWEQRRQRDMRMVKGIFHNKEQPGKSAKFSVKKYKGVSPKTWTFDHGEVRTIPYGIACHINDNGKFQTYKYESPAPGMAKMKVSKVEHRYTFTSLDYTEGFNN